MSKADIPIRIDKVSVARPGPVGWFSIRLLARTGVKALILRLIGTQTGRRELLAALDVGPNSGKPFEIKAQPDRGGAVWVDYVADLGDGFNATHSIAWLVGRDYLFLGKPGARLAQPVPDAANGKTGKDSVAGAEHILPRADLLVFGGDQVYPYANHTDYQTRTYEPYYAARPWGSPEHEVPEDVGARPMFAIPGNHDWYDGLISFTRLFCQTNPVRWIGAWFVQQPRSYFSIKLPHGWWIWGVDVASEDDIDPPQLAYFQAQADLMGTDARVVLCTAKPVWVDCVESKNELGETEPPSEAWQKLVKIAKMAESRAVSVPLFISGDLHHYARHEASDGRQFITCGGGGAFTLGTTLQPEKLLIGDRWVANRRSEFPPISDSKKMRVGALRMFMRHPLFCAVFAITLLALVWLLHTDSRLLMAILPAGQMIDQPLLESMRGSWHGLSQIPTILLNRPGTLLVFALVFAGFCAFAFSGAKKVGGQWKIFFVAGLHFAVQLVAAIFVAVFVGLVLEALNGGPGKGGLVSDLLFPFLSVGIGVILNGLLLGLYLYLASSFLGWHEEEVYSSQAIQDWKCFLRMKVDHDRLTIYPIGLRKVETAWQPALQQSAAAPAGRVAKVRKAVASLFSGDTFQVPQGTTHLYRPATPLAPQLIESPVEIFNAGSVQKVSAVSLAKPGHGDATSNRKATSA